MKVPVFSRKAQLLSPHLAPLDPHEIREKLGMDRSAGCLHVTGPYNSGTNFVAALLVRNGLETTDLNANPLRTIAFKHYPYPVAARAALSAGVDLRRALFVVLLRDPYKWVAALKRSPYEFVFSNLSAAAHIDIDAAQNDGLPYRVWLNEVLPSPDLEEAFRFRSVVRYWSEFYSGYRSAHARGEITAVFVRYEDVVADTAEFVNISGAMLGRSTATEVVVPLPSAKDHGITSGYLAARAKLTRPSMLSIGELLQVWMQIDRHMIDFAGYRGPFSVANRSTSNI